MNDENYSDEPHECQAEKGYCPICGAWMDPMGTIHERDADPAKAYE